MIDKEKIRVGLRFKYRGGKFKVLDIISQGIAVIYENDNYNRCNSNICSIETISNYCDELPETPEQKGKRELAYANKVLEDIEQFELDNIEYLRDKILEKIDRIR